MKFNKTPQRQHRWRLKLIGAFGNIFPLKISMKVQKKSTMESKSGIEAVAQETIIGNSI